MDLFDFQREQTLKREAPLAARMRPDTLDGFFGQEHIVGEGKLLYRAIMADRITSLILYGPPGTGKTTLAHIIAGTTKSAFMRLNATTAGIKDIREVVDGAQRRLGLSQTKTILFVDEIHRFNKAQQDALLPYVEDGTVALVGATTENPYFEVNRALISRSVILKLELLTIDDIKKVIHKAISDEEKGLGAMNLNVSDDAIDFWADMANGDARNALNALELAALTTKPGDGGVIRINRDVAAECIQKRPLHYDKQGDNHYDTISAFIKSMRGSDPDAALYYLGKMISAGEDVRFIARRIVICSSEDVGNADPHALMLATAAASAVDFVGFPEAQIILAQAVTYIACAPKSNAAVVSIVHAREDVEKVKTSGVPIHLRDASYKGAKEFGHGAGYKYAHDFPGHYVKQQYLPDELVGRVYYEPSDNGVEKKIKESLTRLRADNNGENNI